MITISITEYDLVGAGIALLIWFLIIMHFCLYPRTPPSVIDEETILSMIKDAIKESKEEDKLVKQFSGCRNSLFNKTVITNKPEYEIRKGLKMVGRWAEEQDDGWNDNDVAVWSTTEGEYDETSKGRVIEFLHQSYDNVAEKRKSFAESSFSVVEPNITITSSLENIQAGLHSSTSPFIGVSQRILIVN